MIPDYLYYTAYLIIISLFSIFSFTRYFSRSYQGNDFGHNRNELTTALLLTVAMILFVGLRPNSPIFADGPGYYYAMIDHRYEYESIGIANNYLFVIVMRLMSLIGTPPQVAFIVLAFINFFFTYIAVRKLFPSDAIAAMLVFFASFSTFAYAVNGIKAGCAAALFLCALAYSENVKVSIVYLIAALGFHHSMELPIVAFFICLFYKNSAGYMAIWLVSFLIAAMHITNFQIFFADFTDEHGAGYLLGENEGGKGGFRLDFIAYSSVPIILWLIARIKYKVNSERYNFLMHVYMLTNSVWMLCMYAGYTNRIAYLSWGIIPVVLIYPFLNEEFGSRKYRLFSLALFLNLSFTLFMHLVYYD